MAAGAADSELSARERAIIEEQVADEVHAELEVSVYIAAPAVYVA